MTSASEGLPDDVADKGRRNLFTLSLATGAVAALSNRRSHAQVVPEVPPSPPVTPWLQEIPAYTWRPKAPVDVLSPEPQGMANPADGECARDPIQRWGELYPKVPVLYELHLKEQLHSFHPEYPLQPIWGFDGVYPGPTFHARYGKPAIVRLFNELPADHVGFGSPEVSMHLHNLHTGSESDGFPGDYWSPTKFGPTLYGPGRFKDHFYPNIYAGYEKSRETDPYAIGDSREALGTLWYHDHTLDFTAPNVVKGMAGFYLLFDDLDSGNENDWNPAALRLPSGDYDVPLMFQDLRFGTDRKVTFDQLSPEGVIGDTVVVNGKIKPYLKVAQRRYRFRLLAGGPTRWYEFYLMQGNSARTFTYIANDGNLLPFPLMNQLKVNLGVAERADIIVDFSVFPIGTVLYLVNRLKQDSVRGPDGVITPGEQVLKFVVDRYAPDGSRRLTATTPLRPLPPIDLSEVVARRDWTFNRTNGMWAVNNQLFNINNVRANPKKGTAEIWTLRNVDDGWSHPIHIHFEEGRILSRNGAPPPPHERGRKDVYTLLKASTVEVFLRFRDFTGKYPMHCHNLVHEDHAMMIRWDIQP